MISALASLSDLPFSITISFARESASAIISSYARRRHSPRTRGGVAAQPGRASDAAPTASSASSGVAFATSAIGSSVAGSMTGNDPARPAAQWPPISSPVGALIPVIVARSAATSPPKVMQSARQTTRLRRHYQRAGSYPAEVEVNDATARLAHLPPP